MYATLTKWGNSLGFRLPAALAESFNFKQGSKVSVTQEGDAITIRPVYDIKAVFEDYYNKPLSCISKEDITKTDSSSEIDWGEAGNEIIN